jgi:Kef-type K+ transport system membrane component KefB
MASCGTVSLSARDSAQLLLAVVLLLSSAHVLGFLAVRLRLPRVVGEIGAGLVLGATGLGVVAPDLHAALFLRSAPTQHVLGAVYQLGLYFLLFASGAEMRLHMDARERRTALTISVVGTILPFAAGLGLVALVDTGPLLGSAAHHGALVLVIAIAVAVTSIPVIARIMLDLGIIDSAFARIVLSSAVLEDVVLYVVLAVALGLVGGKGGEAAFGVPALLDLHGVLRASIYHTVATLAFFALALLAGPPLFARSVAWRGNLVHRASPTGALFLYLLGGVGLAMLLGIAPMFGAFVAGLVTGGQRSADEAREQMRGFAFAFFVPVYFAIVGLRIDLGHAFDLRFFLLFLVWACVSKALSVYLGARLSRESHAGGLNLAFAMNARGGPGIVLASVAFDAGIVSKAFYASLVLLALVTSAVAGAWLGRVVRRGKPLR